MEHHPDLHA
jgi:hypothetical protein